MTDVNLSWVAVHFVEFLDPAHAVRYERALLSEFGEPMPLGLHRSVNQQMFGEGADAHAFGEMLAHVMDAEGGLPSDRMRVEQIGGLL